MLTKCFSSGIVLCSLHRPIQGPFKNTMLPYIMTMENPFPLVLRVREGGKVGVSTPFPSLLGSPQHVHSDCESLLFKKQNRFIFLILMTKSPCMAYWEAKCIRFHILEIHISVSNLSSVLNIEL